jgi:hypothetical protein
MTATALPIDLDAFSGAPLTRKASPVLRYPPPLSASRAPLRAERAKEWGALPADISPAKCSALQGRKPVFSKPFTF